MKRSALILSAFVLMGISGPAFAEKVADPVGAFTDSEGNQGYVEVAAEDGALLRACNENENTPAGDDLTGYIWVNPNGEDTPPTYGNANVGAGDEDGEDGSAPLDEDGDTNDDCRGNDDHPNQG